MTIEPVCGAAPSCAAAGNAACWRIGAAGTPGLSAFVVDAGTPGLQAAERIAVSAPHPLARLRFDEDASKVQQLITARQLLRSPG